MIQSISQRSDLAMRWRPRGWPWRVGRWRCPL